MAERAFLPREHGFWVMLTAVVVTALARTEITLWVALSGLATVMATLIGAGLLRYEVRKNRRAQLVSAAAFGLVGAPIEVAGGVPVSLALWIAGAWAAIFVSGALLVRGAFARSRRKGGARAHELGALGLAAMASALFASVGLFAQALATGVAFGLMLLLVSRKPTVKQLRPVGLALAGIDALAALVMSVW